MTTRTIDTLKMSTGTVIVLVTSLVAFGAAYSALQSRDEIAILKVEVIEAAQKAHIIADEAKWVKQERTDTQQNITLQKIIENQHKQDLMIQQANQNFAAILESNRDMKSSMADVEKNLVELGASVSMLTGVNK